MEKGNIKWNVMFVIQIVDVYGESLRLLMPSVFWNIGDLGEFSEVCQQMSTGDVTQSVITSWFNTTYHIRLAIST